MSTYTFFARPRMSVLCDRPMGLRPYVGREPSTCTFPHALAPGTKHARSEDHMYFGQLTYPATPAVCCLATLASPTWGLWGGGGSFPHRSDQRYSVRTFPVKTRHLKRNNQDEYQHRCCCCFFQEESTLKAKGKACVEAFCATFFVCN